MFILRITKVSASLLIKPKYDSFILKSPESLFKARSRTMPSSCEMRLAWLNKTAWSGLLNMCSERADSKFLVLVAF